SSSTFAAASLPCLIFPVMPMIVMPGTFSGRVAYCRALTQREPPGSLITGCSAHPLAGGDASEMETLPAPECGRSQTCPMPATVGESSDSALLQHPQVVPTVRGDRQDQHPRHGLVTAYLSPPIRLVIQRRGLHPQPAVRELLRPQMMPVSADEDAGRAERIPPERVLAP